MKDKSLFTRVLLLAAVFFICLAMTVGITLIFGAIDVTLFDFSKLNFSNMIPVFIVGLFISFIIVFFVFMFVGRTAFTKFIDYINNDKTEEKKK